MIRFLIGMFVGSLATVFVIALCLIAKQSDERAEEMKRDPS